MRIISYLKRISGKGIFFKRIKHLDLLAYTDVDWADDKYGTKSTLGYFTFVGETYLLEKVKKKSISALKHNLEEFLKES